MHYLKKNKKKKQPPPDACVRSERTQWKLERKYEKAILKDGTMRFLSQGVDQCGMLG